MFRKMSFLILIIVLCVAGCSQNADLSGKDMAFVRVSPRDCRYLELSDGRPYIPIGLNMVNPWGIKTKWGHVDTEHGIEQMADWMKKLSDNRGNYIRIWCGHPFYDVEHSESGVYDDERAERMDGVIALAHRYGIRVKMTLEWFRCLYEELPEGFDWCKPIHHVNKGGLAESMDDWFAGQKSRERFKKKLDWYAARYGDDPMFFGWELWNEVDAVASKEWMAWTPIMLAELHRRFPKNMAMQSTSSFDEERKRELFRYNSSLPENDLAFCHRYLSPGAEMKICGEPVDVFEADAVREYQAFGLKKPIIIAESGAPINLMQRDKDGTLLHDILFAPFFAGSAGPGQCWYWATYIDRNNLWYHFGRFAEAVKGLDPPAENFQPMMLEHPRLRVYALKGKKTFIAWCRDKKNSWREELKQQKTPELLANLKLDLGTAGVDFKKAAVKVYDPWRDRWVKPKTDGTKIMLPHFFRSLVIRVERGGKPLPDYLGRYTYTKPAM